MAGHVSWGQLGGGSADHLAELRPIPCTRTGPWADTRVVPRAALIGIRGRREAPHKCFLNSVLVIQSCLTLNVLMDCSPPGSSLSMGFSRQAYWSGLPFPSPGDLPDLGITPRSPALQVDCLPSELPEES